MRLIFSDNVDGAGPSNFNTTSGFDIVIVILSRYTPQSRRYLYVVYDFGNRHFMECTHLQAGSEWVIVSPGAVCGDCYRFW